MVASFAPKSRPCQSSSRRVKTFQKNETSAVRRTSIGTPVEPEVLSLLIGPCGAGATAQCSVGPACCTATRLKTGSAAHCASVKVLPGFHPMALNAGA